MPMGQAARAAVRGALVWLMLIIRTYLKKVIARLQLGGTDWSGVASPVSAALGFGWGAAGCAAVLSAASASRCGAP